MADSSTWTPAPLEPEAPGAPPAGSSAAGADLPRRRRGRALLWVLLGILFLAALAAAAWFLLLRPSDAAGSFDEGVTDFRSAPEEAWTYRYAPRGEEDWISSAVTLQQVGSDRMAVLAPLDNAKYSSESDSEWYAGYDEHYSTGYADGERYGEALQAYEDDWWENEFPSQSDYFSLVGVDYSTAASEPGYQGWFDGFTDAENGNPEGASKAERPEAPPTLGDVALVDKGSGQERWSVDLGSFDVQAGASSVQLRPVSPEGHLPLVVQSWSDDDVATAIYALDPVDGSVVSEVRLDNTTVLSSGDVEAAVVVQDDGGVMRLDTTDLGGDFVWSAGITDLDPDHPGYVSDGYVVLSTSDGQWWLDADSGYEPAWFDGADAEMQYRVVGDTALRLESSSFGYYVDALDRSGNTLWTGDAEAILTSDGSGGEVVLRAERTDEGAYEYLMRLDLDSGEPSWDREYDDEFVAAAGTVPGQLLLQEGERGVAVDLETGQRLQRLRGLPSYLGSSVAYGVDEGRISAWDVKDGSELWSMRLSDSESAMRVGSDLLVHDSERREISLLR